MEKVMLAIACLFALLAGVGVVWANPPIQIGHMSLEGGGVFKGHNPIGDHTDGTGMDVRPVRKDGQMLGVRWQDPAYDREATQRLVDTFLKVGGVKRIVFNDPLIRGVTPYRGFDDHLHITVDPNWKRQ